MIYRKYGKTGKKISLLGFGGMRFTDNRKESINSLLRAVELGVNYFDTAPTYCNSTSEEIIGEALSRVKGKEIYVSTKSSLMSDKTSDDVLKRIETSLKKLKVDKINIFHLWCVMNREHFEKLLVKNGPYEGALKAKEQGLVEHISFSTHASGEDIQYICDTGLFEGVLLGYNVINYKYRGPALAAAEKNNMGVVTMNPLGGGLLTKTFELFDFMEGDSNSRHISGALRFNASHREITSVLSGMSTVKEVEENVKTLENFSKPSPDFVEKVKKLYENLGDDFCTDCRYCVPCPQGIFIPAYMRAYDYHKMQRPDVGFGLLKLFKNMLKEWTPSSECIECGECEEKCTQHLKIIDSLEICSKVYNV
ncbi:aldo/keto reductase [candidate division KSB1 bacterium]